MKRQSFDAGQMIFREGDASDGAYPVVSGEVEILKLLFERLRRADK